MWQGKHSLPIFSTSLLGNTIRHATVMARNNPPDPTTPALCLITTVLIWRVVPFVSLRTAAVVIGFPFANACLGAIVTEKFVRAATFGKGVLVEGNSKDGIGRHSRQQEHSYEQLVLSRLGGKGALRTLEGNHLDRVSIALNIELACRNSGIGRLR
jgi:hypothetical protein